MTSYDEPWRTLAGNHKLNNRFLASHWVASTIASIDGESHLAIVGSRFNVAPTVSNPNLGPRKHQNQRTLHNLRVFTLLLKCYLLPLAPILLRMKRKYIALVCNNLFHFYLCRLVFSPAGFVFSRTTNLSDRLMHYAAAWHQCL